MKEQLSALMDNELNNAEALRLLKAMKGDPVLHETWDAYHMLGDALRKETRYSAGFSSKLSKRLAEEPTVLSPHRERTATAPRRFPLAMAASVAAVGLVGVLAFQITRINQTVLPPQIATAPTAQQQQNAPQQVAAVTTPKTGKRTASRTSPPAQVAFSRATSSNYLLAHQEFSPSYAPAYVRVVSQQAEQNQ